MSKPSYLIALVALAACSRSPVADNRAAVEAQKKPTFEGQLLSLDESGRNLAFRNAILDEGLKCERVDRSARQQAMKNGDMWVAHCSDGGDVALFVSTAGFAQVRRCSDLMGSDAPQCKSLLQTQGEAQ